MPARIELTSTRIEAGARDVRLVGSIRLASGEPRDVYFAVAPQFAAMLHDSADPFLPALLVPAMFARVDLALQPPVSELLLGQIERAQDILVRFHGFRRAAVTATARAGGELAPGTAAHFSGGVDSSHTLMRSLRGAIRGTRPAQYLLFFRGLEQPLSQLAGVESAIAAVADVARRTGTTLLVVETNLRDVFNPNYELYYCGAALASASLALANGIGTVLVPSSSDYSDLEPWGSHPLLDELWSTERQRIVFDGAHCRRVDKTEELVRDWPESLQWLRVCLKNSGGGSNCGRCRKCARTMVALDLLGALQQAVLFPRALPAGVFEALAQDHDALVAEIAELAHRVAPGHVATRQVDRALARTRRRSALLSLLENSPGGPTLLATYLRARRALARLS